MHNQKPIGIGLDSALGSLRKGLVISASAIASQLGWSTQQVLALEEKPLRALSAAELHAYLDAAGGRIVCILPAPHGSERRVSL